MNNQQKYLVTGFVGALAIIFIFKAILYYGFDTNFMMATITAIAATMVYLIMSIFRTTQQLVPAKVVHDTNQKDNLK